MYDAACFGELLIDFTSYGFSKNDNILLSLFIIVLGTISSSVFFPLAVGHITDELREKREGPILHRYNEELRKGGILNLYRDRETYDDQTFDGEKDLRNAFESHKQGNIKLIGISLRVFFPEPSTFYRNIENICKLSKDSLNLKIHVLISDPESPEVSNRYARESDSGESTIVEDIKLTKKQIQNLNAKYSNPIIFGYYSSAPYCTLIIFPDKCYFSPNILSIKKPVKLPLIVFSGKSEGYEILNDYFDYLFEISKKELLQRRDI